MASVSSHFITYQILFYFPFPYYSSLDFLAISPSLSHSGTRITAPPLKNEREVKCTRNTSACGDILRSLQVKYVQHRSNEIEPCHRDGNAPIEQEGHAIAHGKKKKIWHRRQYPWGDWMKKTRRCCWTFDHLSFALWCAYKTRCNLISLIPPRIIAGPFPLPLSHFPLIPSSRQLTSPGITLLHHCHLILSRPPCLVLI
jgi:hypothetical protein